jgi:hypothetical protein
MIKNKKDKKRVVEVWKLRATIKRKPVREAVAFGALSMVIYAL